MPKGTEKTLRKRSDIKRIRDHMRALREISHFAATSRSLADFLSGVSAQVAHATEIGHVKILRYRAEKNDLLVIGGYGWKDGFVGHATFSTAMDTAPGRAFQTGMPVSVVDFRKSDEIKMSPILREYGIVSLSNVPLLIDGAAWGVLEVDSETGGAITIGLRITGNQLCLTVADNGRGMKSRESAGTGLRFVEALARQIRGVVSVDHVKSGTTFRILFPLT
jgi:transcriptional regulator with GAF, ATPase, and Fis domain